MKRVFFLLCALLLLCSCAKKTTGGAGHDAEIGQQTTNRAATSAPSTEATEATQAPSPTRLTEPTQPVSPAEPLSPAEPISPAEPLDPTVGTRYHLAYATINGKQVYSADFAEVYLDLYRDGTGLGFLTSPEPTPLGWDATSVWEAGLDDERYPMHIDGTTLTIEMDGGEMTFEAD